MAGKVRRIRYERNGNVVSVNQIKPVTVKY